MVFSSRIEGFSLHLMKTPQDIGGGRSTVSMNKNWASWSALSLLQGFMQENGCYAQRYPQKLGRRYPSP